MGNLSTCDEEMLLPRITKGDERAFKQLFDQWYPLLAAHKWPGEVKRNSTTNTLISQVDLFASLAHLNGQTLKEEEAPDSFDMPAQLMGKSNNNRPCLVTHAGTLSLIEGDWKYIAPSKGAKISRAVNIELGNDPVPQLFHLTDDINEQKNVAEQYPDKVKTLAAKLQQVEDASQSW